MQRVEQAHFRFYNFYNFYKTLYTCKTTPCTFSNSEILTKIRLHCRRFVDESPENGIL